MHTRPKRGANGEFCSAIKGFFCCVIRICGRILVAVTSEDPLPKLTITVEPDLHRQVVEAAAAEGVSVSSWMTAAASRELDIQDGLMHEFHCAHQECGSEFTASDRHYLMRQVAQHLKDAHRVDRATETLMTYLESMCVTSWKP